jgi:ribosomal protein S14
MKKIFSKDKKHRELIKKSELNYFILKQLSNDYNFSKIVRWNSIKKLTVLNKRISKTYISNRCIKTINKKKFHKFSNFSRHVFIKLAKSNLISGLRKSSW